MCGARSSRHDPAGWRRAIICSPDFAGVVERTDDKRSRTERTIFGKVPVTGIVTTEW
jgi:hypothetical protein